jgi:hypothetical protein
MSDRDPRIDPHAGDVVRGNGPVRRVMGREVVCDERARLLARCARALNAYARASTKWQKLSEKPNTPEYRDSLDAREQGRAEVDLANNALERHENLHRCYQAARIQR